MTRGAEPTGSSDASITLGLLNAIERDAQATQRGLSSELGIALGSVNWHLKRCIRKGLIKVQQAPLRRYAYYLTPTGFEEKGRLTLDYIQTSFSLFRAIRRDYAELLSQCRADGHKAILLAGTGELAEAAILSAADAEVELVGVIEPVSTGRFGGLPLFPDLGRALSSAQPRPTAAILSEAKEPAACFNRLWKQAAAAGWTPDRQVLVPWMLAAVTKTAMPVVQEHV